MKRFRSPLHKIQRLQHQQLRLAELALLQARQQVTDCEKEIQRLTESSEQEQRSIQQQFQKSGQNVSMETLKSTFARQVITAEFTQDRIQQRAKLKQQVQVVEAEFRRLKARSQGTDDLLERQFKEHRLESFRKQQVDLEDTARSVSFVNHQTTQRKIES